MRLLPAEVPEVRDHRTRVALQPRWGRVRRDLTVSLAMPFSVVVLCAGVLGLAATGPGGYPLPSVALLPAAVAPAAVYAWWLRGRGVLEPAAWPRVAFVVSGVQVLVAVIPSMGIAAGAASAAGQVVAGVLFVLCWVCLVVSTVAARRAVRVLLTPLVPELGATGFTVAVGVRFALTAWELISARLEIAPDRLVWTAWAHRGRGAGPRAGGVIPFAHLRQVTPIELPGGPQPHPWVALPNGTVLYAQPGPALVLTTTGGQWMVPVHDAVVLAAVIDLRRRT
jgi:uncharacterized membrane protein YtjA (UPF0391 family)